MPKLDDYCSILGVRAGDSAEIVKQAFRLRIKEVHPDTFTGNSEKARLLIEAYRALKDGVPRPTPEEVVQSSFESLYRFGQDTDAKIYDIISRTVFGGQTRPKSVFDQLLTPLGKIPPSRGTEFLERAEYYLKSAIQKYQSSQKRPSKRRASDLIRDLNQVKILYRDVANRHPSLISRCRYRLSLIDQAMEQTRFELHG
ncbi:MAG: hypothetical protein H3C43_04910 [Leptonema sp. (in: Bacteria)]|nr:hypothetical protein [Leptonema sp. (in: bacteria)]